MTATTNELSFDLEEGVVRIIKATPDVTQGEDESVATDVTAYSAWNCAWIPPDTKDDQGEED